MNDRQILDELLALLEANDVAIRREPMAGRGGGLCEVKGSYMFFLDTDAPAAESAPICAQAVDRVVDVENIYIKPEIRQFIADYTDSPG